MRPNELWLEGLAAFRQAQTIDFRALDDLFAIVGPTGSGKTTILDGMSLALFGELPRANQHQRKDFITLGAAEAKVRLDFSAGGAEYRVARRLPRNRSQILSLEIKSGDDWVPDPTVLDASVADVNRRIEQILGFDYDAFTKAVLLPQGDFAQFLRGAADERRKLLSRLLDCEKYERAGAIARDRAKEHEREVQIRVEVLERDWSDATPARRDAFVADAADLRERERGLRTLLADTEAASVTVQQLAGTSNSLRSRVARLVEASEEAERIRDGYASLAGEEQESAARVLGAENALAEAQAACSAAELALQSAISESGDEAHLARLQTAAGTLVEAARESALLAAQKEQADTRLEQARLALSEARANQERASSVEAAARAALETALEALSVLRDAARASTERAAAEAALSAARDAATRTKPAFDDAHAQRARAETVLSEAERSRDALQIAHSAQALRGSLVEGEPCPVCEQVVSSLPGAGPGHGAIQAATQAVTEAKRVRDEAARAERDADLALARALTSLDQAEQRVSALPPAVTALTPNALPDAEQAARDAKTTHESARIACKSADEEVTNMAAAEATAAAAPTSIAARQSVLTERANNARLILSDAYDVDELDTTVERIAAAQERLRTLRQQEQVRRTVVSERASAVAEAARARSVHEAASRGLVERLVALRSRLADEFDQMPASATEGTYADQARAAADYCASLADDLTAQAVAAEAQAVEVEAALLAKFADKELEVPEAEEDQAELGVLSRALTALRAWIQGAGEAAAQAEAEAATLTRRIGQRAEHEARIAELRSAEERYRRIGAELRNDRFIKFVLEESFQELALRASEELHRVSGGRYSLRANGYDFEVIDHANADECRSVVTLSGGESFLASLSLALAFAGSIRDLAGDVLGARLESVFIDEGFGSLDPDVLDIVADGLERVQEDRRQVGIITHVATLAARIPSGLRVEPGPGGSTVHTRQEGL